jgi:hypothetical protein
MIFSFCCFLRNIFKRKVLTETLIFSKQKQQHFILISFKKVDHFKLITLPSLSEIIKLKINSNISKIVNKLMPRNKPI